MERRRRTPTLRGGLMLVCAAVFVVSGGMWARELRRSAREQAANEALVQRVEQAAGSVPAGEGEAPRDYRPLAEENEHLAAWLTIEGIGVDYPVLYTPEEPEYYLRRGFDGGYAVSGCLFIGEGCTPDGSNVLIYGHRMNDGSMFGRLDRYADAAFAREHPTIVYDRIGADGSHARLTFTVMAAFYTRIQEEGEEGAFRYYWATDLSDPADFQAYVEQVRAASRYDLGVTAEFGDRLLTLSTCSYHTEDGRFVVVARQDGPEGP